MALLLCSVFTVASVYAQTKKPNILFLLVDDLGWANVGYHMHRYDTNNTEVKTPNIDYLVANGLEMDRHYVYYICSPTRSSIQSGRLPIHDNISNKPARDNVYNGVAPNYTCIAERLQGDAGYNTRFVGKWDCGSTVAEQTPLGRGYNNSYGYLNHMNDYWNEGDTNCNIDGKQVLIKDLWNTDHPASTDNGTKYEEFLFADKVYQYIDEVAKTPDVPFFIFYASHIAHSPLQIPKDYLNTWDNDEPLCNEYDFNGVIDPVYPGFNTSTENWHCRSIYQSMVNLIDIIIGNITAKLKANGQWENTLIVFSSDNGGELRLSETAANNYPLRGGKFTPWEGGVRVPGFVSGGYLPESRRGKVEKGMVHVTDWYSTFCHLAGLDPTDKRAAKAGLPPIDSLNLWPLVSGENETSPRTEYFIDMNSLIQNNYKFYNGTTIDFAGWTSTLFPNSSSPQQPIQPLKKKCQKGCLYDIIKDPNEYNDIMNENMDVAQKLNARLVELRKTYYTNNEKGIEKCPKNINTSCQCWAALNIYGGFWGPSEYLPNSTIDIYPNYGE